jgi:hypothetical protein
MAFVIWVVFLDLAQERIRELVRSKAEQECLHPAQGSVRCLWRFNRHREQSRQ